jgi:energy-coupling factor transporter ATP-binding protein EcfA2
MIKAEIHACNNITSADIQLRKNHLNICYAMNGTGKSTIAKAIELISKNESLSLLKAFDSDVEPTGTISEAFTKVLLFNEEFVNTIVFKESEVIQNAFEVFIKTPEYEARQKSIKERLKHIYIDVNENIDLQRIISVGKSVLSKFSLTKTNELKQTGLIKSLTSSESIFKLPEKIKKFQPLMDKEYNVDWVGWKNDGSKYDDNHICPFCTSNLSEEYSSEKELFTLSYTKSNVKNIKETLSFFDKVKDFMNESKSEILYHCIKDTNDEQTINLWVKRFYDDLKYLVEKISNVLEFNSFRVGSEDISHLDEQLKNLRIDLSNLEIFNNQKVKELIDFINQKIDSVLSEIDLLKSDIGQQKGLIGDAKTRAVADINEFLRMADINYRFEITHESENISKSMLKYISRTKGSVEVDNIRLHLSWGERNAFALVLFMHHALSQNPEIIILDDPISSFDTNKKYAIIHRLFNKSSKKSFYGKTVLMLTHELQPIIDFIINNKPNREFVSAHFLRNNAGVISQQEISETDIKSMPILLADNSKNEMLNKIHRVACVRKLLEHMPENGNEQNLAYNLLSCLLHGKEKPGCKNGAELTDKEIKLGEEFIRQYVTDFEYTHYFTNIFTTDYLLKLFIEEKNSYFRLQVFRVLLTMLDIRSKIDDPLLKYIDEQFHVENDYMFCLDFIKYDIVPDFVILKCTEYLKKEHLIA